MRKRLLTFFFAAAALAALSLPARADGDQVQFGHGIHVDKDAEVHDAVCFFCSVHAEGRVNGDIVVLFGNVHLSGDAQHDLVNIFGKTTIEDGASVEGDTVNVFGGVRVGENVTLGKDLAVIFGSLRTANSVTIRGDRTFLPGYIFFGPLGLILLVIFVLVHELRAYRRRVAMRNFPIPPHP